jgi:hypothetical protein
MNASAIYAIAAKIAALHELSGAKQINAVELEFRAIRAALMAEDKALAVELEEQIVKVMAAAAPYSRESRRFKHIGD